MEKLGIQPILIIAQIVNFVILLLLLKKFLFKPILKVLDERKKKAEEVLQSNMLKIQLQTQLMQKLLPFYLFQQIVDLIFRLLQSWQFLHQLKEKEELLKKGQKELEIVRKKLESEIEADKKEMFKEIKRQSAEMAVLIAEKVMQESFDENKQKSLLNQAIKDLEKVSLH